MAKAKRTRRKIPELHGSEFVGMRVAVAFNLHKARGTDPQPGEFIYTVREKAGGKVLAHVDEIALVDVTPKILPGSLRRIKERKVREVCCYLTGTVVRPAEVPKRGRKPVLFNPFKADCFTAKDGRCVWSAEYVLFTSGRKTLGVRLGFDEPELPKGPRRKRKPKLSDAEKAANTRKLVNQIALGGLRL
jgi:hypothetical protein